MLVRPAMGHDIVAALLVVAATFLLLHVFLRRRCPHHVDGAAAPPVVPGWPLLGSAIDVGIHGTDFISACRRKHGDAFTLNLAGQRMTFVFHPAALQYFFTAPDSQLSFLPAVEQFTHRVFGLPPADFLAKHHLLLSTLRHQLVPSTLQAHAARLLPLLVRNFRPAEGQVLELHSAMQSLLFPAAVESLFGPQFLRHHGRQRLQDAFFAFENGFELAASPVPHLVQPRFRRAKATLLAALRESFAAGHFAASVVAALIEGCELPPRCVPNLLLAVLWASQANTIPAAFWAVAFLLLPENGAYLEEVRAAAATPPLTNMHGGRRADASGQASSTSRSTSRQASPRGGGGGEEERVVPSPVLLSDEEQQRLIDAACDPTSPPSLCALEALRLRAPSIDVRVAAADIAIPASASESGTVVDCRGSEGNGSVAVQPPASAVRAGSVVAICPWEGHLDARLYPDPGRFNPHRAGMQLGGSTAKHGAAVGAGGLAGVAFGGGRYRCPGRSFAEMELALVVAFIVGHYDLELVRGRDVGALGWCCENGGCGLYRNHGAAAEMGRGGDECASSGGGDSGAAPGRGRFPGDPGALLPPADMRRLVGVKTPGGGCWVRVRRRRDGEVPCAVPCAVPTPQ